MARSHFQGPPDNNTPRARLEWEKRQAPVWLFCRACLVRGSEYIYRVNAGKRVQALSQQQCCSLTGSWLGWLTGWQAGFNIRLFMCSIALAWRCAGTDQFSFPLRDTEGDPCRTCPYTDQFSGWLARLASTRVLAAKGEAGQTERKRLVFPLFSLLEILSSSLHSARRSHLAFSSQRRSSPSSDSDSVRRA